jgi:hypothetical protein
LPFYRTASTTDADVVAVRPPASLGEALRAGQNRKIEIPIHRNFFSKALIYRRLSL